MITLAEKIPEIGVINAEMIKIRCLYDCYKNDDFCLFWVQDVNKAVISMTDGNMVIYNNGADFTELREFLNVISPVCVFSDFETLKALDRVPDERINVMHRKAEALCETVGDEVSSKEIYKILNAPGLSLPEYPYFAVDYCRRLNHGGADYFAIKNKCAAITFNTGKMAIMNGIASHEKGYGSIALKAALTKNCGREFLVCCRDSVVGFYEKNGFRKLYNAGYWVKLK